LQPYLLDPSQIPNKNVFKNKNVTSESP